MVNKIRTAILVLLAIAAVPAHAGSPCSIDHAYPEVAELRVQDGKLVAFLGSYFSKKEPTVWPNGTEGNRLTYPKLSMTAQDGWQLDGYGEEPKPRWAAKEGCFMATDDPENAVRSAYGSIETMRNAEGDFFDESISSCAIDGDVAWGGISFYGAEGGWGIGGIARKDLLTEEIEYFRHHEFRGTSTGPVAHFAGYLWVGTTWHGECYGPSPGNGMKRMVTQPGRQYARVYEVPEVCGFAVRAFQEHRGALWVATELGLSKLIDDDGPKWTNFVPDLSSPELLREVTCDELYTELLSSSEFAETEGFDMGFAFDVFWDRLSKHRPAFVRRYLRDLHGHESKPRTQ